MTTPLLQTKLYIPPVRPELVPRPRLIERLNAALHRKLTLISAPAGFGKTTLLSEWASQRVGESARERPVAWLSLDEGDNDPARFLAYLTAALQTVEPDIGAGVLTALQSPQPPPAEAVLIALINEIATISAAFIFVLDDYHLITAQPVHDALAFLLDHLPPNLRLGLATRADPPLPLARLRARGQLTELRAADLRFTTDEAVAFLNDVMGLRLTDEDVATLESRTEGWIAGLQMAALSMRGRDDIIGFIQAFSGSHRFVLDYLVEEVLEQQPGDVQEFLLKTSILERITAPLCDAVVGRGAEPVPSLSKDEQGSGGDGIVPPAPLPPRPSADSQKTLEYLEHNNLFVVPLDDERRWYRYHRLFADLLRSRLQQMYPDQLANLHLCAAEWFEKHHFIGEALHHALAAEEQTRAVRLVKQNAMAMLMRGELTTLLGWLRLIESLARQRPWLSIYQSWALTLSGQLEQAAPWLQEAERLVAQHSVAGEARDMGGHVAAIRAYQAAQRGEASRAIALADQALERLPESNKAVRSVVMFTLGRARRLSGDLAGAHHQLFLCKFPLLS